MDASRRVYRVDRFTAVEPSGERFQRDASFELPAFWADRAADFQRSILRAEVVLRLSERGARLLPLRTGPGTARESIAAAADPDPRGWITVTLPVETLDVAYDQLLGLGPECEVIEPPALRARMAAALAQAAAHYA